ncbi:MAG: DUF1318 domain-containing protein [Litorimonas sp.]
MKKLFTAGLMAAALLAGGAMSLHLSGYNIAEAQQAQQSSKAIVDAAKDRGEIGEKYNGQLEAVTALSPNVEAAMDDINIRRKTLFVKLAKEKNESLLDVGKVAAVTQFSNAKPGHFLLGEDGVWKQK